MHVLLNFKHQYAGLRNKMTIYIIDEKTCFWKELHY